MVQIDRDELQERLFRALDAIARDPERAPDDHIDLARAARGLAPDVVDTAFAAALARLVVGRPPGEAARSMAFVAAEQFAHHAGADRFGPKTKAQVAGLLRDQAGTTERKSRIEAARARAHLHELRRAVGAPTTLAELDAESELRDLEPGLWLDLAQQDLAPDAFLKYLEIAIESRQLAPSELLPRLQSLIRGHGAGIAQRALDVCCQFLHRLGRYEVARGLVARAERIAPLGWTIPCQDPVTKASKGYGTAARLIADFREELTITRYPVHIIQRYRILAIPLFAYEDYESVPEATWTFLEIAQSLVDPATLWLLAMDESYRANDQNGRDWFSAVVFSSRLSVKLADVLQTGSPAAAAFAPPKSEPRLAITATSKLLVSAGFA